MNLNTSEFKINDTVVHCREGLSTIISVTKMGDKEYFLIKTNKDGGETIYVPRDSNNNIIRHVMREKEADKILLFMKSLKKDFNPNTKQRRDAFRRSIASGDVKELAYLARYLYFYNQLGTDNDEIKLGPVDLEILNDAHNMLMDEFALTFGVHRDKIVDYINKRIAKIK